MKKICIVTGTRADYGQLRWLMKAIDDDANFSLQIIATGMHLSPEFGHTYLEIEADGFAIDRKLETLLSADTTTGVVKSMGLGVIACADALGTLDPDLVVILGDRFEALAVAVSALAMGIPIAHIHGGEITEGAIDDMIRHSITKMAHLHFVAAEEYRRRVIQLGESPDRVFAFGGLGVDAILRVPLLGKDELEDALGFTFGKKNLLVTFHPVTLDGDGGVVQMKALLDALDRLEETHLIFTFPNADAGGREIIRMINEFAIGRRNVGVFRSLGQQRYLSCVAQVDGVIGNSSSGLTEVPTFRKGTINIGSRQSGRIKSTSVIDCLPTMPSILAAIERLYSPEFQKLLASAVNPYGKGGTIEKILDVISRADRRRLLAKKFYDISIPSASQLAHEEK